MCFPVTAHRASEFAKTHGSFKRIQELFPDSKIDFVFSEFREFEAIHCDVVFVDKNPYAPVAAFTLGLVPYSNTVVSAGAYVDWHYKNKGIGQELHKLRLDLVKELAPWLPGIMCVTSKENETQEHILTKFNWLKMHSMGNFNYWFRENK